MLGAATETRPAAAGAERASFLPWNEATIRRHSEYLGEPHSILALRREALARLKHTPWPTAQDEAWRRNDPRQIGRDRFKWWDVSQAADDDGSITPLLDGRQASLVDVLNCRLVSKRLAPQHKTTDLAVGTLQEALQTRSAPELEQLIMDVPDDKESPAVSLLHVAFSHGGSHIIVPDKWSSPYPVVIRHRADHPGGALFPLNLLKVGRNAQVTVVLEQDAASSNPSWFGAMTRVTLGDGARLNLLTINRSSPGVRYYDHFQARLGRESRLQMTFGDVTSGWAVIRREVAMSGPGSEAHLRGAYVGCGEGLLDLRTLQEHTGEATTSDLMFKSALFDRSKSVYQGLIKVHPKAVLANAYQLNRNLLMSPGARADSIPKLEILVDEVRCTHGASAGKLGQDALFYLRSRGLSEAQATRLMVEGFLEEAGAQLEDEALRRCWREAVVGRADAALN